MIKILIPLSMLALSSCSFNNSAEAMPPVHELYHELSVEEQQVYNSFTAEERTNVNQNVYIYQLRQAVATDLQNKYDY